MAPARILYLAPPSPKRTTTSKPSECARTPTAPQGLQHLLHEAFRMSERGDVRRAQSLLQQAEALFPRNVEVRVAKGNLAMRLQQLVAAETEFRKALELDADFAAAHMGMGAVLLAMGREDEAILYLEGGVRRLEAMPHEARRESLGGISAHGTLKKTSAIPKAAVTKPRPEAKKSNSRDFIIGSVYKAEQEAQNTQEAEALPLVDELPAPSLVHSMAVDLGSRLGQWTQSPITRANTLLRTLNELSAAQQAELACQLVSDWSERELATIAGGGLRALKNALTSSGSATCGEVLEKLERVLAASTSLTVETLSDGVLLLGECSSHAAKRAWVELEESAPSARLPHHIQVVMVLPPSECATPKVALLEYLHRIIPEFPTIPAEAIWPVSAKKFRWPMPWLWARHLWRRFCDNKAARYINESQDFGG